MRPSREFDILISEQVLGHTLLKPENGAPENEPLTEARLNLILSGTFSISITCTLKNLKNRFSQ